MIEERNPDETARTRECVDAVLTLQNGIFAKLKAIGFLKPGEDDRISHHLAEAALGGSALANQSLPSFLSSEGEDLANAAVDLVEDLREIRETIEAVEEELLRLMNYLTK
jgi:hypothetical protein